MVRIEHHAYGRRLHVGPYRLHHWHFALAFAGASLYLLVRDWRDFTQWLRR